MENLQDIIIRMKSLQTDKTQYMRPVVLVLAGEVRHRIHVEGRRPDGGAIGKYDGKYLLYRAKFNRSRDTNMIYSLTRQMEQDFVPIAENNEYGLGFNNNWNFKKATWLEEMRPGVYALSSFELHLAEQTITDYLNGLFG